jgi:hypothetical protein
MVGRRVLGVLLAVALVPTGCGLLAAVPAGPEPVPAPTVIPAMTAPPLPSPVTAPVPSDAPAPYSLRAAVEPARRFLLERRAAIGGAPFTLRFVRGYCAVGAQGALAFEQLPADGSAPTASPTYALAFADDIAAGIIADAWFAVYDVPDLATQPDLLEVFADRGIPCP